MALLTIFDNPFTPDHEKQIIPEGANLGEWLLEFHGDGFGRPFTMYYNTINQDNVITPDIAEHVVIGPHDNIIVVLQPMSGIVAAVVAAIVAIGVSIALAPEIPEPFDEEESSGTNKIKGQRNVIRINDRVPRVFGKVRVFPDLIYPSYYSFELKGNSDGSRAETEQVLVEYFCIGEGDHKVDIDTAKQGDDLISRLSNTTVEVYNPLSNSVTEPQDLLFVKESTSVKNIELSYPVGSEDINTATSFDITSSGTAATINSSDNVVDAGQVMQILSVDSPNAGKLLYVDTEVNGDPDVYTVTCDSTIISEQRGDTEILVLDTERDRIYRDFSTSLNPYVLGGLGAEQTFIDGGGSELKSNVDSQVITIGNVNDYEVIETYQAGDLIRIEWSGANSYDYDGMWEIDSVLFTRLAGSDYALPAFVLNNPDGSAANFPNPTYTDGSTLPSSNNWPTARIEKVATALERDTTTGVPSIPNVTPSSFVTPMRCTDVWIDVAFKSGLYRIQGSGARGERTVEIEVSIKESDSKGKIISGGYSGTFTEEWTENTSNPLRFTLKASDELGTWSSAEEKYYLVTCRRKTSEKSDGAAQETITWERLAAVVDLKSRYENDEVNHGNITTCRVTTRNVSGSVVPSDRKFNVEVTAKVPVHDITAQNPQRIKFTGPTQKWMDALIYTLRSESTGAGLSESQIDYDSIAAVQASLDEIDGGLAGEFNHVFSTRSSIDEELAVIGRAARASIYRIGGKVYAARDERGKQPIALFNRRNKVGDGDTRVIDFGQEKIVDHIEFTYLSKELNYQKYTAVYPDTYDDIYDSDASYDNPKKVNLDGVVHWKQAWREAVFEYNREKSRRDKLTLNTTYDSRVLGINDVVSNADLLTYEQKDGEVIGYNPPKSITLDQDTSTIPNGAFIELRNQSGDEVDRQYIVSINTSTDTILVGSTPSINVTTSTGKNVGTLYRLIYPTDVDKKYIVKGMSIGDGSVDLSLEEYNEENVYAGDDGSAPSFPAPFEIEPEGLVYFYDSSLNDGDRIGDDDDNSSVSQHFPFFYGLIDRDEDASVISSNNVSGGGGYAKFNGENSFVVYDLPRLLWDVPSYAAVYIINVDYENASYSPIYSELTVSGTASRFGIGVDSQGYLVVKWRSTTGSLGDAEYSSKSTLQVTANEDAHIGFSKAGDIISLYINGQPAGTVDLSSPTGYTVDYGSLGSYFYQGSSSFPSLNGSIMDIRISSTVAIGASTFLADFNALFYKR